MGRVGDPVLVDPPHLTLLSACPRGQPQLDVDGDVVAGPGCWLEDARGARPRPALAPIDLVIRVPWIVDPRLGDLARHSGVAEGHLEDLDHPVERVPANPWTVDLAAGRAWP